VLRRDVVTPRPAWLATIPLFLGSVTCTLSNNIVNVPLHDVMRDLHVSLARGALIAIAFSLTTAVTMPFAGWLADRIGRRRVYLWAVALVGVASVGASIAPNLDVLLVFRVLQAVTASCTLPAAMGILTSLYGIANRGRALAVWAAANGFGQAVGPPLGGVIAGWLSWRWIFTPTITLSVVAWALSLLAIPRDSGVRAPVDWKGAALLTSGAGTLIAAASLVPQLGVGSPAVVVLAGTGVVLLAAFGRSITRGAAPFVDPGLFSDPAFLRSAVTVFSQMFSLGVMTLAVPLFLTRTEKLSTSAAGVIVFALPAAMTAFAPMAGRASTDARIRHTLGAGVGVILLGQLILAAELAWWHSPGWALTLGLVVAGAGTAFVQAPAATGATQSSLGRAGAALGLFNLIRFTGLSLGAALVAVVLSGGDHYGVLFLVCSAVLAASLMTTFVRRATVTRAVVAQ
jgi:EmrB/QacA subfamily drug resistance transporter